MAFGPGGIELLTEAGERRSNEDIAADIEASLLAWDAGTERNQAGAAGPDQAPHQAGPNTGADEGGKNENCCSFALKSHATSMMISAAASAAFVY